MFKKKFNAIINNPLFIVSILILGFLIRLLWVWYMKDHQMPDFHCQYHPLVKTLITTGIYNDTRPPGLILFFTPFYYIFRENFILPALIAQIFVSLGSAFLMYLISKLIFNEFTAKVTLAIGVFYPWLIFYTGDLGPENWYIFWILLTFYHLIKISLEKKSASHEYFLLGLFMGFTALIRSMYAAYIPLALCLFWIIKKISFKNISLVLLGIIILTLPWAMHNSIVYNKFSFSGDNSGHNLYLGLNPYNKTGGATWGTDAPPMKTMATLAKEKDLHDPFEISDWYKEMAVDWAKENPKEVFILALKKFYIFWRPFPRAPEYTNLYTILIIALSFIPIVIGALITLYLYRKNYFLLLIFSYFILFILQLNAIHLIFAGSLRYRFPIEPLLIILAVPALFKKQTKKNYLP